MSREEVVVRVVNQRFLDLSGVCRRERTETKHRAWDSGLRLLLRLEEFRVNFYGVNGVRSPHECKGSTSLRDLDADGTTFQTFVYCGPIFIGTPPGSFDSVSRRVQPIRSVSPLPRKFDPYWLPDRPTQVKVRDFSNPVWTLKSQEKGEPETPKNLSFRSEPMCRD